MEVKDDENAMSLPDDRLVKKKIKWFVNTCMHSINIGIKF